MMPDLISALPVFLAFILTLVALSWCSRQISEHIQLLAVNITGSTNAATVAIFLVLLPGVIVHEAAHWITAYLLGLKPSKFRVWPKKQGKFLGLGSISIRSGGLLKDSLVGLAPLIVGTILVAWITHRVLNAQMMASAMALGQWRGALEAFLSAFRQQDGALWAYLLFTISNAMMPSPSDREPVTPVVQYALLAGLAYLLIGLPVGPLQSFVLWLTPFVQSVSSAFLFIILLDLIVLLILFVLSEIFASAQMRNS
ncbi:MAG: hypothetical protein R3A44_33525 [Caldilineaceae bacterium]